MTDKKLNVLDRLLLAFRQKKETCPDIISQADNVINRYITVKNNTIHRKCKQDNSTLAGFVILSLAIISAVAAIKLIF